MRRIATANHETERRDSQNLKRVIRAVLALLVMASLMITTVCAAATPTETPGTTGDSTGTPTTDDNTSTPEKDCRLTIHFLAGDKAIHGVVFSIYRVADVILENKTFKMLPEYENYPVNMNPKDWAESSEALARYVRINNHEKLTAKTDAEGSVYFNELEQGVYLVIGSQSGNIDGSKYTPAPSLLTLPAFEDATLDWTNHDLAVNVKSHTVVPDKPEGPSTPDPETVSVRALKVWEGDEDVPGARPDSVTVDLVKDGTTVEDTVELSAETKWRYDWDKLDAEAKWTVVEHPVDNYTVTYDEDGVTQTITNTYDPPRYIPDDDPPRVSPSPRPSPTPPIDVDDPDVPLDPGATPEPSVPPEVDVGDPEIPLDPGITPDPIAPLPDDPPIDAGDPDVPMDPGFPTVPNDPVITEVPDETPPLVEMLPQTGMLWWPVPIMALLGAALILLGSLRRRSR